MTEVVARNKSHDPRLGRTPAISAGEFAVLVDAIQDYLIIFLSPAGDIRSWNRGAERILGYTAEEVIGSHFSLFYEPDKTGRTREELLAATAEGRVEDEGWRIRKDGSRFWADTVITALRSKEGKLEGFAKVTRDLTRRRAAEERLRQSEEIFRLLVGAVKDYAIFMLDPQGHIATWNEGAQRIKGYTPDEIIGKHFSVFYPEVDIASGKPERELATARAEGSVIDEGWRLRKDGTMFWAYVVITAVHDEKGELRGFAKVTRDITERKRSEETQLALMEQREARLMAEAERRRAEASFRAAEAANRSKDEFLATLSHELRTPLTAILGWSSMLRMGLEGEQATEAIEAIEKSAKAQAELVDDILDVSRIMSGKLSLDTRLVDLRVIANAALTTVHPAAEAKNIEVLTSFTPDLPPILGDEGRLQQVIWNLLANAIKFTAKHGSVTLRVAHVGSVLRLTVQDTGKGIDAEFLPHVFEPFRQADATTTRVHGGIGLGLAIVRQLVELHGGRIAAASEGLERGSTFTVDIPVPEPSAITPLQRRGRESAREPRATVTKLPSLAGLRILEIDDQAYTRDYVAAVLRRAGAFALPVTSVRDAFKALETEPLPDLVICDIAMPGEDGYDFLKEFRAARAEFAHLPVIALTAFGRTEDRDVALAAGFDEYVVKPVEPVDLVNAIRRVLKR